MINSAFWSKLSLTNKQHVFLNCGSSHKQAFLEIAIHKFQRYTERLFKILVKSLKNAYKGVFIYRTCVRAQHVISLKMYSFTGIVQGFCLFSATVIIGEPFLNLWKPRERFPRPNSIDFKRVNYNYFLQIKSDIKNITLLRHVQIAFPVFKQKLNTKWILKSTTETSERKTIKIWWNCW